MLNIFLLGRFLLRVGAIALLLHIVYSCKAFEDDKARQARIAQEIWEEDSQRVAIWLDALTIPVDSLKDSLLRDSLLRHSTSFSPPSFTQQRQPSIVIHDSTLDSLSIDSLQRDSNLQVP